MKLNNYNRLMAIARSPEYIKDCKALDDLFKTDEKQAKRQTHKLLNKWNLAVRIPLTLSANDKAYFDKNEIRAIIDMAGEPLGNAFAETSYYKKYMYREFHIQIDLTRNEKELISAFKACIGKWKQKDSEKQPKKTDYDPWIVFDMYVATPNYTVIARKLSGIKGNQTDNPALRLALKRTKNAFDRAIKMIATVEEDACR
jgi:hypothetical protein